MKSSDDNDVFSDPRDTMSEHLDEIRGSIRAGGEIRHDVALPSKFLVPRSALQVLEDVFYGGDERHTLGVAAKKSTPEGRMVSVLQWYLHSLSAPAYLKKPYNPVLGETHMFKAKDAYVIAEQVSHHPPVTAYYGEDLEGNARYYGQFEPRATFSGMGVLVRMIGRNCIQLMEEELYELPLLNLHFRLLPPLGAEWVGKARILCKETKICTVLEFKPRTMMPMGSWNVTKGTMFRYESDFESPNAQGNKLLMSFKGSWKGEIKVIQCCCKGLPQEGEILVDCSYKQTFDPVFRPDFIEVLNKGDEKSSQNVWGELTKALFAGNGVLAAQEKHKVETSERALRKLRKLQNTQWSPRFFLGEVGTTWSGETTHLWNINFHELMIHVTRTTDRTWSLHCACCMPPRMRVLPRPGTLSSHPLPSEDLLTPRRTLSSPMGLFSRTRSSTGKEDAAEGPTLSEAETKKLRKTLTLQDDSRNGKLERRSTLSKVFGKSDSLLPFVRKRSKNKNNVEIPGSSYKTAPIKDTKNRDKRNSGRSRKTWFFFRFSKKRPRGKGEDPSIEPASAVVNE